MIGKKIYRFDSLTSTSDKARELAVEGCPEGSVIIAASQSQGRGKPGASWYSPPGGIYLSIVLRPYKSSTDTSIFTLMASRAVISCIERMSGLKGKIKPPNDVLLQDKKVCGVLIERLSRNGSPIMIVGIGINLNIIEFSPDIAKQSTSLGLLCGKKFDQQDFIKILLEEINKEYFKFLSNKL